MNQELTNQQVVEDYIETIRLLSDYRTTIIQYPALVYPLSLLAHSKSMIRAALNDVKEVAFLKKDYELV